MSKNENKKSLGLALGGGGARGIAHIGAVQVLLENGIVPKYISGSSMGSLIGSLLAFGHDWDSIEATALSFDKTTSLKRLFDFGTFGQALMKGKKVRAFLDGYFGDSDIQDAKIPLAIVACDLMSGEEIVIREGSVRDAIMASIAVPGIFPPVRIGERLLVDGGVVNPTPIDVVREMGAEVVLGVDLISKSRKATKDIPNIVETLMLSYEIIRNQAMLFKMKKAGKDTLIIMPGKRDLLDSFRFYDVHQFIHAGEESMNESLADLEKMLSK